MDSGQELASVHWPLSHRIEVLEAPVTLNLNGVENGVQHFVIWKRLWSLWLKKKIARVVYPLVYPTIYWMATTFMYVLGSRDIVANQTVKGSCRKMDINSVRKASLRTWSYLNMDWAALRGSEFIVAGVTQKQFSKQSKLAGAF